MGYTHRHQRRSYEVVVSLAVITSTACCYYYFREITAAAKFVVDIVLKRKRRARDDVTHRTAYETLIANGTPLVKLENLSRLTQRSIYVKMESMNPGGTGKDRAALSIIQHAEENGLLPRPMDTKSAGDVIPVNSNNDNADSISPEIRQNDSDISTNQEFVTINSPLDEALVHLIREAVSTRSRTGGLVVEGTSGSTGIALATLCAARGHACLVVMPDDQAIEKQSLLRALGAVVHVVPNAAISNPNHYVNIACKAAILAKEQLGIHAVFGNQFENYANFDIHYHQTGPELLRQCPQLDAFCMSSGTGGTIAGVGKFLKERTNCKIVVSVSKLDMYQFLCSKIVHPA